MVTTLRAASDIAFFRGTFFTDRVQWIFSACFHFGLLLVLLRHLRYALDPAWVGPILWKGVMLAQPFGLYGGLLLIIGAAGFWMRLLLMKEVRDNTAPFDYFILALLLVIPTAGYLNNFMHTDVIAVKSFFVGLVTLHWTKLPTDAMLLIHLWLVAVLMVSLPFSQLLHMAGVFDKIPGTLAGHGKKIRLATASLFGVLLLVPAAIGIGQLADEGWTRPQPDFARLARIYKNNDPTVMIRNHPRFLMNWRAIVVYKGVRQDINRIEMCVDCHAVEGADGKPVGYDDSRHFCVSCHYRAAVSIDCFECHNPKPVKEDHAAVELPARVAANPPSFNDRRAAR